MITGKYPSLRLRRSRKFAWSRRLIQENNLSCNDLIYPIFLIEGNKKKQPIKSMPGVFRYTVDNLGEILSKVIKNGIPMVALFHQRRLKKINLVVKLLNEDNLICKALKFIKKDLKIILELCVMWL